MQLFDNAIYEKCISNLEESKAAIKERFEAIYEKDEVESLQYAGERNIGYSKEDEEKRNYINEVKKHTIQNIYLVRDSEYPG